MTNQSQLLKELKHSPRPPLSRHSRAVIPTLQNMRQTTFPICVTDGGKPRRSVRRDEAANRSVSLKDSYSGSAESEI